MRMSRAAPWSAALFLVLAETSGCSPTITSFEGAEAEAVCPSTPEETVGAPCAVPGLRCGPQYTCGSFQASLLCVCTDGVFHCTDGTGRQLRDGGSAMCPGPAPAGACPPTERSAQLASCGEQGLLCSYPSPCTSRLDQCQCFGGATADGGFGLRFECVPAVCGGPDAGPPVEDAGSPVESSSEAGADSGAESGADGGYDETSTVDGLAGDAPAQ